MTWTRYRVFLLVLFVTTGSINTLSTKWADVIEAVGSDGVEKSFNHPFFQSLTMFLGEAMCLVLFKIMFRLYESRADGTVDSNELTKGNRKFNAFILCVPTACDMAATSLQNVGLNLTYASSFQMLRGSIIVFVGLLSVAFLRRRLAKREWGGIVLVMAGLSVVGVADFLYKSDDDSLDSDDVIIGDVLIVVGQVIQAIQVVVEEKFVAGMDIPPLEAVGFEGLFGLASMSLLMVPFYYIRADRPFTEHPGDRLDDIVDAFSQMGHSWQLDVAVLGTAVYAVAHWIRPFHRFLQLRGHQRDQRDVGDHQDGPRQYQNPRRVGL
ncbi:solute carrier family 35 member F6-like isoform X2 [Cylas formicarius]|uniref:solute carrier family 35 member F6-like isoform X2 n=1 Tax=Cylas formicarius TaxID=197179 RepID=UPI00295855EB|nr:solute carrier family 35 member F6-like isoform X2 [Cylas formicarius]